MKDRGAIYGLLAPWAGLVVGVVAAGTTHQFGAAGTFDHCQAISPVPLVIVAFVGIVVTAAAALASWGVLRASSEPQGRRVVAAVSVGAAALFILAMILPIVAALVIPPCFQ